MIMALLLINLAFGSSTLTFDEIKSLSSAPIRKERKRTKINTRKSLSKDAEIKKLKEVLEAHRYVAKMQLKQPFIMSKSIISELDLIGARSEQAINATNSPRLTTFSNIKGADLPTGSKISCEVFVKHKRVCGNCKRIIINGVGHDIEADLYNRDGSPCVIGKISNHKETYLTGMFFSEMAKGAMSISQSSIPTIGGNLIKDTAQNKITQGLINTASTATDLMKEEYQTNEPIVSIAPKTDVTILFKKRFEI